MNIEFIKTDDEKQVSIITDGAVFTEVPIQEDNYGHKYIKLPNLASPNFNHPISICSNFHDRIGDMYECIRNGWGDEICIPTYRYGDNIVIRYLDREFGESRRNETLERSKNFKFKYAIFSGQSEGNPLNAEGDAVASTFDYYFPIELEKFKFHEFISEEDANQYIKNELDSVRPFVDIYNRRKEADIELAYEFMDYLVSCFDKITRKIFKYLATPIQCGIYVGQVIDYNDEKWFEVERSSINFPSAGVRLFLRNEILNKYKNKYDVIPNTLVFHEVELRDRPSEWTSLPMFRVTDLEEIVGNWFLSPSSCLSHPSYQQLKEIASAKGTVLKMERGNVSICGNYRHDDFMRQVVLDTKHRPSYYWQYYSVPDLLSTDNE